MKIIRQESPGWIEFDSESLTFQWTADKPRDFEREAPKQEPFGRLLSAPVSVYFELTRTCNLACRHCFTSSSPKAPQGFPFPIVKTILDDLRGSGVINVRFTGGELTVHPDWRQILGYAKTIGLVVSLQSNGAYSDESATAIVDTFRDLGLDQISFSIDGHRSEHDHLRGKGNYDRTLRTLRLMGERGLPARINTILTPRNLHSIESLVADIAPYTRVINLFQSRPIGRGDKRDLEFRSKELNDLISRVRGFQEAYPGIRFDFSGLPTPMKKERSPFLMPRNYGFYSLTLSYDGRIWPHHYSVYQGEVFELGSYPATKLLDVWRKSPRLARFRDWISRLDGFCEACSHYRRDCPGIDFEIEHLHQTGSLDSNPYCYHLSPRPKLETA